MTAAWLDNWSCQLIASRQIYPGEASMQLRRFGLALTTTLIYGAAITLAQEAGQIVGVVRDPTGAVIPGVTVRAEESQTGFDRTAVTNASGQYELRSLRPTTYVI